MVGHVEEGMDGMFTKVLQTEQVEISTTEVLTDPMVEEFHGSPCLPDRVLDSDGLVPVGSGPHLDPFYKKIFEDY